MREEQKETKKAEETRAKEKKNKKKRPRGNAILILAIWVCILVMAYSGFRLVRTLLEYKQGTDEYNNLRTYTVEVPEEHPEEEPEKEAEKIISTSISTNSEEAEVWKDATDKKPPIEVDWDSLKAINDDIVGWIYIGSIDVSYPVVQGDDDDYYLHRTFEGTDNFAGSIFVEYQNGKLFRDPNTIIYGHNMKNESMFGRLAHIQTEELYRDDPWFWIMTPRGNFRYRMFSMRRVEVEDETYTLFQGTDQGFLDWCDTMYEESDAVLEKPNFSLDSHVVTLSTCTTDSGHRFVVQGVAVK